ncbi:hypothetical protein VTK26DRAFT_544 [Humicola hyalothermophila]
MDNLGEAWEKVEKLATLMLLSLSFRLVLLNFMESTIKRYRQAAKAGKKVPVLASIERDLALARTIAPATQ